MWMLSIHLQLTQSSTSQVQVPSTLIHPDPQEIPFHGQMTIKAWAIEELKRKQTNKSTPSPKPTIQEIVPPHTVSIPGFMLPTWERCQSKC